MIDVITTLIASAGVMAPLYYILAFQVAALVPVIPTPLIGALGGTFLGFLPAVAYGVLGLALGALTALTVARLLGRPLLLRILAPGALRQWEQFLGIRSLTIWGILFFVLNLDFVVMISGLTTLPLGRLWLAAMIARTPWLIASAWFGDVIIVSDTVMVITALLLVPSMILFNRALPTIRRWIVRIVRPRTEANGPAPDEQP